MCNELSPLPWMCSQAGPICAGSGLHASEVRPAAAAGRSFSTYKSVSNDSPFVNGTPIPGSSLEKGYQEEKWGTHLEIKKKKS